MLKSSLNKQKFNQKFTVKTYATFSRELFLIDKKMNCGDFTRRFKYFNCSFKLRFNLSQELHLNLNLTFNNSLVF